MLVESQEKPRGWGVNDFLEVVVVGTGADEESCSTSRPIAAVTSVDAAFASSTRTATRSLGRSKGFGPTLWKKGRGDLAQPGSEVFARSQMHHA